MNTPTKLLVVDDNPADQLIASRTVRKLWPECEILKAADGEEAIELLESCDPLPDAILLDINMPRMNGHAFLEAFYANRSKKIPVVLMLTSSDQVEDQNKVNGFASVKGFLVKPASVGMLSKLPALLDGD